MKRFVLYIFLLSPVVGSAALAQSSAQKYWIFFRDKGPVALAKSTLAYREAARRLSDRAIQRRLKVRPPERLLDETDLEVYPAYLQALQNMGIHPIVKSRWLNAVSAYLTRAQLRTIATLPFVKHLQPVRRLNIPRPPGKVPPVPAPIPKPAQQHVYDYGLSQSQNELVNVPLLHDAGIAGKGVIVGMLDTGFNFKDHPAFQSLQVLGQFDFVFNDSVTADEPGKDLKGQETHGTETLSVIAGFDPGNLIGPAFEAQFYLSKTEDIRSETPAEEDFWMAGIEWMEAQGIDVASSSLGYRDFDDPANNHTYEELDGKTTVVTRAAQMAAEKGVVVVNSAGNEGNTAWRYFIAPADGIDVLAVGAVTAQGIRAGFSSIGPTVDGRIKPDVMAMGVNVELGRPSQQFPYTVGNGTSFSCPMVAGIAAQILSSHPYLNPRQVLEALRMTASQAEAPDNLMGYGIVDAKKAITYWGPAFSNHLSASFTTPERLQIAARVLSDRAIDTGNSVLLWRIQGDSEFSSVSVQFADSTLLQSDPIPYSAGENLEFYFKLRVAGQGAFTYPHKAPDQVFVIGKNGDISPPPEIPETFALSPTYPNPFFVPGQRQTFIVLKLPEAARVRISVYNILGQEMARLIDGNLYNAGNFTINWDGHDKNQRPVPSGIYFFQAEFQQENGKKVFKHKKFLVIQSR